MNEKLASSFDQLAIQFKKDKYRSRAYKNAASALRSYPDQIRSGSEAQDNIKGIGKSIATKIDELLATGKLELIESRSVEEREKEKATKLFEGIYGIGSVTSEKLYNRGFRTLEDLKSIVVNEFTDAQKLGYSYYYHLQERIPRAEMDQYKSVIDEIAKKYGIVYEICGSYRRGEVNSGDIDCLIRKSSSSEGMSKNLTGLNHMNQLLNELKKYIVGHLAVGTSKYMGIIRLSEKHIARRIDLLEIDADSWPYATLYFTGSKNLNVIMRTKALELGYTMNEHRMVDNFGKECKVLSERDIFANLGMEYLEPTQRSIGSK